MAELHESAERTKVDPSGESPGRRAYPRKFYVVCPPVQGYRGCGTILANGAQAQARMMELGRVFGAGPRSAPAAPPAEPPKGGAAPKPAPEPAQKARNPFSPFRW
nr:MAG: hypothetical protein DIU80_23785 [Chloroflexota bacterium]